MVSEMAHPLHESRAGILGFWGIKALSQRLRACHQKARPTLYWKTTNNDSEEAELGRGQWANELCELLKGIYGEIFVGASDQARLLKKRRFYYVGFKAALLHWKLAQVCLGS